MPVADTEAPAVRVVRSRKRRRTISSGLRGTEIVVRVPAALPEHEVDQAVTRALDALRRRAARSLPSCALPLAVPPRPTRGPSGQRGDVVLVARAHEVRDRLADPLLAGRLVPAAVRWSHRMHTRWASCTPATGVIRVSARLADAPDEVLDHVLWHELVHLVEPGHGRGFRALLDLDPCRAEAQRWQARRELLELRAALGIQG